MATITTPPNGASSTGSSPPRGSNTGANASGSQSNIDPSLPAGIISFTDPPQASTSFFKIAPSEPITFAWNASGILATPTSLTIQAVASGFTYPVGPNNDGTVPGGATSVVWDVYSYSQANRATPLVVGMYQLQVYDERGLGAVQRPGYLSPNQNLNFGLYTPQGYTPLASGWTCTVCQNGALASAASSPLFISLFISLLVMFLSGFSLVRQRRR